MTRRTVLKNFAMSSSITISSSAASAEQQSAAEEYELKAAFLFHIAKFAEWPAEAFAEADSPIVVAVAGRDPFGPRLDRLLQGQTVNARRFRVERVATMGELREAHIVFLNDVAIGSNRSTTLTVGNGKKFCRLGGMIALYVQHERLVMEVNLAAVNRSRIKLSAQLLKLATIVEGAG